MRPATPKPPTVPGPPGWYGTVHGCHVTGTGLVVLRRRVDISSLTSPSLRHELPVTAVSGESRRGL